MADHPAIQAMAEAALRRPRPLSARLSAFLSRWLLPSLGVGVLAAAAVVGAFAFANLGQETYRTQVGERRAVKLADGSTLELNTDSQVRVRLTESRRELSLDRGQALFVVTHDAARPFVVTAGDTSVRAIGTRFEVYREASGVQVTLAQGRVEVSKTRTAGRPVTLAAGERMNVGAIAGRPVKIDVAAATGWTEGRLTFREARLAQAVEEINRYSKTKVVLGAGVSPDQQFNGVFDTGDTEAFVAGISTVLDLKGVHGADGAIELVAAARGPAAS